MIQQTRSRRLGWYDIMPVFQLEKDKIYFPLPELGEPDGLLAVGGDLSIDRLLLAYSNGIFPWYNADQPIMWWCPMERFIIRPPEIHISHSMKKYIRKHHIADFMMQDLPSV